jgi:hypothetical protein
VGPGQIVSLRYQGSAPFSMGEVRWAIHQMSRWLAIYTVMQLGIQSRLDLRPAKYEFGALPTAPVPVPDQTPLI